MGQLVARDERVASLVVEVPLREQRLVEDAAGALAGLTVERLRVGVAGCVEPLPANYDWTKAEWLNTSVDLPDTFGGRVSIDKVLRESAQHPEGTYLFGAIGWMDTAEVQRKIGKSFMTICTPDPKRSRPAPS